MSIRPTEQWLLEIQHKRGLKVHDPVIDQKLKKAFGIRKISEDELQIMVMNYIRSAYPEAISFHVPNGGARSKSQGALLKAMGVLPGVSDVFIMKKKYNQFPLCIYSGLIIELKVKPNKPTKEQLEFLKRMKEQGFQTHVCYEYEEAKKIIDEYLTKKNK